MTAWRPTIRDLYTYSLRRGVISNEGRLVASALASSDELELDGHLFETDDRVQVRTAGGTLPAPLVANTVYYVIRVTDSTFKLSLTEGGSAINLTSDGDSVLVIAELPIAELLEAFARFTDDFVPHGTPSATDTVPVTLVRVACDLTAAKLLSLTGQSSVSMNEAMQSATKQLELWRAGLPVRDANASASTNLAIGESLSNTSDPRGWGSRTLP